MTCWTLFADTCFCIAASLPTMFPALAKAQTVRAEVRHAATAPYTTGDPEVPGYRVEFSLRVVNASDAPVSLPASGTADDGIARLFVASEQRKQPDGSWAYLSQSSYYDSGNIKYGACTTLKPGEATDINGLVDLLLLPKDRRVSVEDGATMRFGLWLLCRQPDGKVMTTSTMTEGFDLRLPDAKAKK